MVDVDVGIGSGANWRGIRALSLPTLEVFVGSLMRQLQLLSIHLDWDHHNVSAEVEVTVFLVSSYF